MELPHFRYHPDPFASGVVEGRETACQCCGERRGLFYTGPFYSAQRPTDLCLWCVADGMAAEKFDGDFVDEANFPPDAIDDAIVEEVTRRTPAYRSWQQEQWLTHCDDACVFHGYPSTDEVRSADDGTKLAWMQYNGCEPKDWETAVAGFVSGQAGFYKFVCRQCGQVLFATDWS